MGITETKDVEKTLQKPDIHQQWENSYRTKENEKFYDQAFDYIANVIGTQKDATFLDVGCGIGAHSIRLSKHGFSVVAIDSSEYVLKSAEQNLQSSSQTEHIKLQYENILSLSFADRSFDYILCWGVLMHIPDINKAISELDRVLKKDGIIVIAEDNMFSLQSIVMRSMKKLLGITKTKVKNTEAGMESWKTTSSGMLLTRQANIKWLKNQFKNRGYSIKKHVPGQFTELYIKFSSRLFINLIHGFNHLWFKYVKAPRFAFGNILILQKQS